MKYVEVLLLKRYVLPPETFADNLSLLPDGLGPPVYLLEDDLHHCRLELGQEAHLFQGLFHFEFNLFLREFTISIYVEERW